MTAGYSCPPPSQGEGQIAAGYPYPSQGYGGGPKTTGYSYPPQPQGEGQMTAGYSYPPPPQGQGPYCHPQQGYGPVPGGQGYNYPAASHQNPVTVVSVQPRGTIVTQARPTNWLGPAILATLCCFCPTGICAIVSAVNANSAADRGDYEDANRKALTARNLTLGTVACGIVLFIVVAMMRTFLFATSYNSSLYDY
ncbi:hypothetical protein FSP39_011551 [Pinctada imbricata]|uniref:Proline-rich transmembrane protein 1 n=1 Tax=Pinctada imbricata TaxID=66713 RepID=A0AA88YJF4_PINIB|nr:hypothetical protein FSP39_011551 [Pinctada imbricata]